MLINLSNHPSKEWSKKQLRTAHEEYGPVVDLSFPQIPPDWDYKQVLELTEKYMDKIRNIGPIKAVHIQGEFVFTFSMVRKFQSVNLPCIVSTTRRAVDTTKDGLKVSRFDFVRFREYPQII